MESIIVRAMVLFAAGLLTGSPMARRQFNEPIKSVRLSGRVTDSTGGPIANAAVKAKVTFGQPSAIAQTDLNGRFTFPAVVPQQFELFVEAHGFSPLVVGVKAPRNSAKIDVGTVAVEIAPIETAPDVHYQASALPDSLKSKRGATILQNTPADREETSASRWQTTSCAKDRRSGRSIVSMNHILEFYIPPSAHLTETADADYVEYHVRYNPKPEKMWLNFMFGPMVGEYTAHNVHDGEIRWTWRKWTCNGIEGNDVRGLSSDGGKWRYISIPTSGFAAYEGVTPKAADYFDGILDTMCCVKRPF